MGEIEEANRYKFGKRCIDYYISPGCASACYFCSEPIFCKRHWTALDPGRVVDELEHLKITYNIDTFMIRDSDFFLNLRRVKELSNLLIERDLGAAYKRQRKDGAVVQNER